MKMARLIAAAVGASCATAGQQSAPRTPFDANECGPLIAGADDLRSGDLVVLGELHGLTAAPAFAADLACRLAARGFHVSLALEIPKQEQARLDAFLSSKDPQREALLEGEFWKRPFQDGRSSEARYQMLDALRKLRERGVAVRVPAFDDETLQGQQVRETGMAENILASRTAGETTIVLVGNLHARTTPINFAPNVVWMAATLRQKEPQTVTFDNRYLSGEAWTCQGPKPEDCQVRPVRGNGTGQDWRLEKSEASAKPGAYDGVFQLGAAVASPPARSAAAK